MRHEVAFVAIPAEHLGGTSGMARRDVVKVLLDCASQFLAAVDAHDHHRRGVSQFGAHSVSFGALTVYIGAGEAGE